MDTIIFKAQGWHDDVGKIRPAFYGKNGIGIKKGEGDSITPIGNYHIRQIFYRADKCQIAHHTLPLKKLQPHDGWCDAPNHSFYNRLVFMPFNASHEALWRADTAYDIIIVLSYNDAPIIPNKGSAIFIHLQHMHKNYTEGCIALPYNDMQYLLTQIHAHTLISITL